MAIEGMFTMRTEDGNITDQLPDKENNILYDILIYTEWPQEPEYLGKTSIEKGDDLQGFLGTWLNSFSTSRSLPASLYKFVNRQLPWRMAVGGEGKILAVLQENVSEIRSSRDDFGSVIGKCSVPKDPLPEWRQMCFSADCSMLAVTSSGGQVYFFDLLGNPLFTINLSKSETGSTPNGNVSHAVAGMVFVDCRLKSTRQWSSEFLVATYGGKLHSFFVSPTDGFHENHKFSLRSAYPRGISSLAYHPSHQVLFVSGWSEPFLDSVNGTEQTAATGRAYGLTAWRLLSDYPHYKMVTTLQEDGNQFKKSFLQRIPRFTSHSSNNENYVLTTSVSPSGGLLAAVHSCGSLSLWHLPSLRLKRLWELDQQPYQLPRELFPEVQSSRKKLGSGSNIVINLNWWSDEAMILARQSGAVTVSSVHDLQNLLGQSAEPFEPSPQVSAATDKRFLVLESECAVTAKGRSNSMGISGFKEEELSSDDEDGEGRSLLGHGMQTFRSALYYITDSERFQPPRRRAKILTRNFRLLCLKSTTPEELFARKLDNEEYGEALALAKVYNLDCDLVYQRQWRKTAVSVASIQDYLSKISKRSWVIHECLERVPDYLDAARSLLLYGLQKTDLQALAPKLKVEEEEYDDISAEQPVPRKKTTNQLLKEIDFKNLTMEQKQLCQYRLKLLMYLDRLNTYEIILGGGSTASELFESSFFSRFRKQSGLEAAIFLAREGNAVAVADMLTYHGNETLVHRLPIVSNFPETMSPLEYRALLPEAGYRSDEPEVYPWDEIRLRELDWCETHFAGSPATPDVSDFGLDFYEENKDLLLYRQETLTPSLLTEWYLERVRQIESRAGAVDNALELIKCGRERNVQGLEQLHCELLTLEALVYECQLSEPVSLKTLESRNNEEKIKMLMQESTSETFVHHCRQRLLPFLDRLERSGQDPFPLLLQYLLGVAVDQLLLCQLFLQASKPDVPEPLLTNLEQLIAVALECIYACQREDQLSSCCAILECLPERGSGEWNELIEQYHKQADELERHIMVCRILEEYGCPITPARARSSQSNPEEVKKLLFSLANSASSRKPALTDSQWREVLFKMLDMQKTVFKCVEPQDCYEMLVSCLLCSGRKETISLAATMIQGSRKKNAAIQQGDMLGSRLSHERSLNLVLVAAEKYFNLAAEVDDPSIALAKSCLNLMTDVPPAVEKELDLIQSLSVLQEFSLNLIPLQVRLCKDRLDIIKQALRSKPQAYGNIQKLLRLATLLRVCGDNKEEREGQVITLVAEAALEGGDYKSSYQACRQLMEQRYVSGWTVCRKLGTCASFQDIKCRIKLLSFSVAYCSPDLIEELMRTKQELELQELKQLVSLALSQVLPSKDEPEKEEIDHNGEHLLASGLRQTKEISLQVLQTTHVTTRKMLATVGSSYFWKDAIKMLYHLRDDDIRWIQTPGPLKEIEWDGDSDSLLSASNKELKRIGVPTFYLCPQIQHDIHISQISTSYNKYLLPDLPQNLKTHQNILRAALIEDLLREDTETDLSALDPHVLLELCRMTMSEDTALALGFLYPLLTPADAEEAFSSFPRTAVILEVAAYFFCLCMLVNNSKLRSQKVQNEDHCLFRGNLYMKAPKDVIEMGEKLCSGCENTSGSAFEQNKTSDGQHTWTSLFLYYRRLLSERTQADLLGSLHEKLSAQGNNQTRFDIENFLADDTYKTNVMLQLASSPKDVFEMVKSLAQQYNLSLWEILFRRIKHLVTDISVSLEDLELEASAHKMTEVFGSNSDQFRIRIDNEVLPFLEGSDLPRLAFVYSLLEKCGDLPNTETGVRPNQELRLIKKLISSSPGINYLELMNPDKSENIIYQSVGPNNIQVFVKNASRFPRKDHGVHSSSSVYRLYGQKLFFELNLKKHPSSFMDWVHRYENCSDAGGKMTASDFLEFINQITFSEVAVKKVPQESRVEINRRALKHSKHKEHTISPESPEDWQLTSNSLKENLDHLKKLEDDLVLELKSMREDYAIKFDMTRSVPQNVENLVVEAVLDGLPMACLQTLLALVPVDLELDPTQAYSRAVQLLAQHLRCPEFLPHPFLEGKDSLSILTDVMADIAKDGELLSEDHQVELLSPVLSDPAAPATYRMAVADLLETDLHLSPESQELVLFCRTQCLVSGDWPEIEVTQLETSDPERRKNLFGQLLTLSENRDQLEALARLALTWPHSDTEEVSWLNLFLKIIPLSQSPESLDEVIHVFQRVLKDTDFGSEGLNRVFECLHAAGSIEHVVHFAVIAQSKDLMVKAHHILKQTCGPLLITDKLQDLLLDSHLLSWSAGTPMYGALSRRALLRSSSAVNELVHELQSSGHETEAGTLLMSHQRSHPSLATFTGALATLRDWMSTE